MSKYGSVGLSFLKTFLVPQGASPVFYVAADSLTARFPKSGAEGRAYLVANNGVLRSAWTHILYRGAEAPNLA